VCIGAFKKLEFRDYARFDMRIRFQNNTYQIFFLETNANPGLDDDDAYGLTLSFKAVGMTFRDFLLEIIASAMRRATH
jgi:D-alanine-D-alanine ligase-like ATP-grasp enzyme